jgi:hypothetical protein
MKASALSILLILLAGCADLPSAQKVERLFARDNGKATVLGVSEQLTNNYAIFHIYYKVAEEPQEHEAVWNFHRVVEGWVCDNRQMAK